MIRTRFLPKRKSGQSTLHLSFDGFPQPSVKSLSVSLSPASSLLISKSLVLHEPALQQPDLQHQTSLTSRSSCAFSLPTAMLAHLLAPWLMWLFKLKNKIKLTQKCTFSCTLATSQALACCVALVTTALDSAHVDSSTAAESPWTELQ